MPGKRLSTNVKARWTRNNRATRVANGLCANCGRKRDGHSKRFCMACLKDIMDRSAQKRAARRAAGQCYYCSAPAEGGKSMCDKHARKQYKAVIRHELRVELGIARKNIHYRRTKARPAPVVDAFARQHGADVLAARARGESFYSIAKRLAVSEWLVWKFVRRQPRA